MPSINYATNVYKDEHFAEIFQAILHKNKTVENGLVRVYQDIKFERPVTSFGGSVTIQPYKSLLSSADSAADINLGDSTIKPVKMMIYKEFDPNELIGTRFQKDMKSGAANIESNEFLSTVLAFFEKKISLGMENAFWKGSDEVTGILQRLNASSDVIKVTGTTLTEANLKTEFQKVYKAIPDEIIQENDVKIFADHSVYKLVSGANQLEAYRDVFTANGSEHYFRGIKIEYVPLGANKLTAGRPLDFMWGTDLMPDMGTLEVNKVQANSDIMFIKSVFTLDTAIVVPTQKVLYA